MYKKSYKGPRNALPFLFVFAIAVSVIIGIVSAYFQVQISMKNEMQTAQTGVEFVEQFMTQDKWLPGETINKKPYIKNTGEIDLLVRIRPAEEWQTNEGALAEGADSSLVIKNYTDAWENGWIQGNDGYYYYKSVLPAGGSTAIILDSIVLSPEASNDDHAYDYSNLRYVLAFEAEYCAVDSLSDRALWNAEPTVTEGTVEWTFTE